MNNASAPTNARLAGAFLVSAVSGAGVGAWIRPDDGPASICDVDVAP
jgi:hypothetical protein